MVTTTEAAAIAVTGDWNCDAPVKNDERRRHGARAVGRGERDREQEVVPAEEEGEDRRGEHARAPPAGTITLRNACQRCAPSTWAACSSSQGIWRKKADIVQIGERQGERQVRNDQAGPGVVEAERRATCRTAGRPAPPAGTSRSPAPRRAARVGPGSRSRAMA